MKNNIYLVGQMYAGKTLVGEALARYLHLEHYDTDSMVEQMFDKDVTRIYNEDGQPQFRIFETAAILQTTLLKKCIVSTGSGCLERTRNGSYMKEYGEVVYFRMREETQLERMLDVEDGEVPESTKNKMKSLVHTLHEKRNPAFEYYADLTIDIDGKSALDICKEILNFIQKEKV